MAEMPSLIQLPRMLLSDYRKATGFEALMGFLYLTNQTDRMLYLIKKGIAMSGLTI